jgi:hypothetical protein
MARHTYRKRFEHEFEAEETARGFVGFGPIGLKPVEVSVAAPGDGFWVYLTIEGEVPPDEMAAATGYERVA